MIEWRDGVRGSGATRSPPITVLAIVAEPLTRALLPKTLASERLALAGDSAEGLMLAQRQAPDVAFVDITIGDGAGVALVHHLKAIAPECSVYALATTSTLEAAAHAVALGGAGLLMLPLGGDDILNAVSMVKTRLAEKEIRTRLERTIAANARATAWLARTAELAGAPDRTAAARQLVDIFTEACGARGAAVYLAQDEHATELVRAAAGPALQSAPAFGTTADIKTYAEREGLQVVPLSLRALTAGYVLLLRQDAFSTRLSTSNGARLASEPWLELLASQASTTLFVLGERDRSSSGATLKDPTSSAYSFGYYVDVAGREIDRARRFNRRFAIADAMIVPHEDQRVTTPAEIADQILHVMHDIDVLARIDEHEFHLLLPETDGLAAHACRRRILSRPTAVDRPVGLPREELLVGVAVFPHDGQSLPQLLRVARRRAEATKTSVVHRISSTLTGISDLLDALLHEVEEGAPPQEMSAPRPIELSLVEAAALAQAVVDDGLRGGSTFIAVAHHPELVLGTAVQAAVGPARDHVTLHAFDIRSSPGCSDLEALVVIAEHGSYALIGRSRSNVLRGVHSADPLLADLLAERLGRAAGFRVFG
jgi:DNA-binding NarL/FixJ family response regulator